MSSLNDVMDDEETQKLREVGLEWTAVFTQLDAIFYLEAMKYQA